MWVNDLSYNQQPAYHRTCGHTVMTRSRVVNQALITCDRHEYAGAVGLDLGSRVGRMMKGQNGYPLIVLYCFPEENFVARKFTTVMGLIFTFVSANCMLHENIRTQENSVEDRRERKNQLYCVYILTGCLPCVQNQKKAYIWKEVSLRRRTQKCTYTNNRERATKAKSNFLGLFRDCVGTVAIIPRKCKWWRHSLYCSNSVI